MSEKRLEVSVVCLCSGYYTAYFEGIPGAVHVESTSLRQAAIKASARSKILNAEFYCDGEKVYESATAVEAANHVYDTPEYRALERRFEEALEQTRVALRQAETAMNQRDELQRKQELVPVYIQTEYWAGSNDWRASVRSTRTSQALHTWKDGTKTKSCAEQRARDYVQKQQPTWEIHDSPVESQNHEVRVLKSEKRFLEAEVRRLEEKVRSLATALFAKSVQPEEARAELENAKGIISNLRSANDALQQQNNRQRKTILDIQSIVA